MNQRESMEAESATVLHHVVAYLHLMSWSVW